MGDPGQISVRDRDHLVVTFFNRSPAHMLPDKVEGSSTIEKDSTDSTDHGAEGSREARAFYTGGIQTLGFQSQHGQRDTDVGYRTDVSRNSSAGGNQSDVNDLHGYADQDTGADIAKNKAADQSAYQGTAQGIVTDGGTTHTGHG